MKLTTMIKKVYELENEIRENHDPQEVVDAFDKLSEQGYSIDYCSCTYQIYEGAYDENILNKEFPDED